MRITIENVGAKARAVVGVGVARHFCVGHEASGVKHPLVIVAGAETIVSKPKVDSLNLEGGKGGFVIDGVAGNTGIAGHTNELSSDFNLIIR